MTNVIAFPALPEPEPEDSAYTGPVPVIEPGRLTYTVDQVAYLLNLSRGVTYQYVREGVIPAERVGRRWIVSRKRLRDWLDGTTEGGN